jgi:hypothetical protein
MPKLRPKGGYRKPKPATEPSSQEQQPHENFPDGENLREQPKELRYNAYPQPLVIPDHLWSVLRVSLTESPKNARRTLRSFCVTFDIPMEAVAQRMEEEAEALLDDNRVLH